VVYLRDDQTLRHLRAGSWRYPAPSGIAPQAISDPWERVARAFLRQNRDLMQLQEPDSELQLERRQVDPQGHVHLRFAQRHQGLAVWPASLVAHFGSDEQLIGIDGAYAPTPVLTDLTPTLTPDEAVARAKAWLPGGWTATSSEPELILYAPLESTPRLSWKFDVVIGLSQAWRVVIDAHTGRILHRSSRIFDSGVAGSGVDLTGASRALNVWQQSGTFYLLDTTKPMYLVGSDPIQNPRGVISITDARGTPINQLGDNNIFHITSTSANSWTVPAGVSAAFNFGQTYDYFRERHARNSLDNQGGNILAIVQVGGYDNASWHGNLSLMLFGDVRPFAASLDVVGHELSHGITEKTAGLIYERQSGALNESFSDIFGEMVEARTRGVNDWLVGSELAQPLRNLKNPGAILVGGLNRPFPAKMSEFIQLPNTDDGDHGGVHLNSSIINHCFYQLAEGLPSAVGRIDAERIFYLTLTQYLQAQSQFVDCRLGALSAAESLFGMDSLQVRATAAAFDRVEIFAAPTTPNPTPVPLVEGPDSTLFVYEDFLGFSLGRRETAQGDPAGGTVFVEGVRKQSPAVTGDGSLVLFVSEDNDLCLASTEDSTSRDCFGFPGAVHSVAVSPDGNFAAFVLRNSVTGQPDGSISVIDLVHDTSRTFNLVAPAVDGVAVDQVLYADAMTFSTDSRKLIYDAVSQVQFASGPTLERWSLYGLDLVTERTEIIVPPLEGIDTGNPSPGRAGTRFLTFDAQLEESGNSGIVVLDQFTGQVEVVGMVEGGFGFPSFTGDERAVIYAAPDGTLFGSGKSLFKQGLSENRLARDGDPLLWQEDAVQGVVYRRGHFVGTNALPTVTLTVESTSTAPASVTLAAVATDTDGTIARVEFFNGASKLGEATSANNGAHRFAWNAVAAGQYRLVARVLDNLGGAGDSRAIEVTVVPPGGTTATLTAGALPNGSIRLSLHGTPGNYIIAQSPNLTNWSDIYPITVDNSGNGSVDDAGGPLNFPRLFYRARLE